MNLIQPLKLKWLHDIKRNINLYGMSYTCKYCLDDIILPNNNIISPCDCKGTMNYVHKTCFSRVTQLKCNVCNLDYPIVAPINTANDNDPYTIILNVFSTIYHTINESSFLGKVLAILYWNTIIILYNKITFPLFLSLQFICFGEQIATSLLPDHYVQYLKDEFNRLFRILVQWIIRQIRRDQFIIIDVLLHPIIIIYINCLFFLPNKYIPYITFWTFIGFLIIKE